MRNGHHGPDVAWRTPVPPPSDILPWSDDDAPTLLPLPPAPPPQPQTTTPQLDDDAILGEADPLLDPDEIPHHPPDSNLTAPDTLPEGWSLSFRHSGWASIRERVYAGMRLAGLSPARLNRFAHCGTHAWVEARRLNPIRPPAGQPDPFAAARIRSNCCRDRFCIPCAAARARTLARQLIALLKGQPARFITFTRRSDDSPLADQIDALYDAYRLLRKTRLWSRSVDAAAAMLEVTRNKATGRWHPHLHVLASGRFIPHAELRRAWTRCSGGSFIVDIRLIRDHARAAAYVSKYVSKPMVASYASTPTAIAEALAALRHRRMILLTGDWARLTEEDEVPDGLWENVGRLEDLVDAANEGDADALNVLTCLWRDGQWRRRLPPRSPPTPQCPPTVLYAEPS